MRKTLFQSQPDPERSQSDADHGQSFNLSTVPWSPVRPKGSLNREPKIPERSLASSFADFAQPGTG